jgi:hypothetical protein
MSRSEVIVRPASESRQATHRTLTRTNQVTTTAASRLRWNDAVGWIALAWALFFGALYVRMMVEAKAPGAISALRRFLPH